MATVKLCLPSALRALVDDQSELLLATADDTLAGALLALVRTHPAVARRLLRSDGTLQHDTALFFEDGHQTEVGDMATRLIDGETLTVIVPRCL